MKGSVDGSAAESARARPMDGGSGLVEEVCLVMWRWSATSSNVSSSVDDLRIRMSSPFAMVEKVDLGWEEEKCKY